MIGPSLARNMQCDLHINQCHYQQPILPSNNHCLPTSQWKNYIHFDPLNHWFPPGMIFEDVDITGVSNLVWAHREHFGGLTPWSNPGVCPKPKRVTVQLLELALVPCAIFTGSCIHCWIVSLGLSIWIPTSWASWACWLAAGRRPDGRRWSWNIPRPQVLKQTAHTQNCRGALRKNWNRGAQLITIQW